MSIRKTNSRTQNLGVVRLGETKRTVGHYDIEAAKAYLADVHNSEQMRSACAQLRPEVRREMVRRGLLAPCYA